MKKRYLGTILLFVFVLLGCYSKDNQKQTTEIDEPKEEILLATNENFVKIMNKRMENFNYEIITKLEGNFTNSGLREVLVFFKGQHKRDTGKYFCSLVFIIAEDDTVKNVYRTYYALLPVSDRNLIEEIDLFEEEGNIPSEILKIVDIDPKTGNFVSKNYEHVIIGNMYDILESKQHPCFEQTEDVDVI